MPPHLRYGSFITDATISTISHLQRESASPKVRADELIVLLDCDRPTSGSSCHRLEALNEVVIGRGPRRRSVRAGNRLEVSVPDGRVSSVHAFIRRDGESFIFEDAGSKNGTVVNGVRAPRRLLRDRDVIECGRTVFLFRASVARPIGAALDVDSADLPACAPGLMTFHAPFDEQVTALRDLAQGSMPVFIVGESGTGKELVARALHTLSKRRGAFIGVNCGALPDSLVEAELFGVRKGAFTGANEDRIGLVRAADNGTLFLDEVGELSLRAQPTLLRVLQEREVIPVGATRPQPVDFRLVTATHRNLDELVADQRFRADLFARISGFTVRLPTLNDRPEDMGLLIGSLLKRHCGEQTPAVTVEAMRLLLAHVWPLNVRELEHCLRAALSLSPTRLEVERVSTLLRATRAGATLTPSNRPRRLTPEQEERRAQLIALLAEHNGNISEVARRMGKDRVQIRRWIRQLAIRDDGRSQS